MGESLEATIDLLSRIPLLAELSSEELKHVAQVAVPRHYPAGSAVIHEGDSGDVCYIVRSGSCKVTRQHPDGRAITLTNLGQGDLFGELAMLDGEIRSATVETLEDTHLLAIAGDDMRALMRMHPSITVKLVVALTRQLRELNDRVCRQSFQTVPSRVAGVLLQLTDGRDGPATIHMKQADLAQLAGASRETVSRFLAGLEREHIVTCGRGQVTVNEPQRLRSYIY